MQFKFFLSDFQQLKNPLYYVLHRTKINIHLCAINFKVMPTTLLNIPKEQQEPVHIDLEINPLNPNLYTPTP
jgi:hypothetical protein